MKYLIGAVIGVLLAVGGVAVAASVGIIEADNVSVDGGTVTKIYDQAPNIVCYVYKVGDFGTTWGQSSKVGAASISCLKNN